jgi:hypothetical protein
MKSRQGTNVLVQVGMRLFQVLHFPKYMLPFGASRYQEARLASFRRREDLPIWNRSFGLKECLRHPCNSRSLVP